MCLKVERSYSVKMELHIPLFLGLSLFVICCVAQRTELLNLCELQPGYNPNGDHMPAVDSHMTVFVDINKTTMNDNHRCLMRFTTCINCRFKVKSKSTFNFPKCRRKVDKKNLECSPGCTYLHMFDPDYRNETTTYFYNGPFHEYMGESKTLYIVFCTEQSPVLNIQFELVLQVHEKVQKIKGSSFDINSGYKFITTPFFPSPYTENSEEYLYEFRAINNEDYILLIFDDWNLAPTSSVKFEFTNLQGYVHGSANRPSVLSNGPFLKLYFYSGSSTVSNIRKYIGFKVSYKFYNKREYVQRAQTSCGEYLLKSDGGTLMFSPSASINDFYDCIWVVKLQPGFSTVYTKLEAYENSREYYSQNHLEIRDGLTSNGGLKASVTPGSVDASKLYGHDSTTGFYIRLKGRYRDAKDFILTYASYKYGECTDDKLFKCDNRKCISSRLKCDGYNHCGDDSDEKPSKCRNGESQDSPYSYTLSVGVIIPIVISVFLIVVICLLIIFIRRCRRLSSLDDRQRISTVSGQIPRGRRRRNRQRISMNLTISQDNPPTYEEVIRSTPIGHLNMAFMWSQPEIAMIQPPSYEEATSPQGDQLLTIPHNLSSSSSEIADSVPGASPVLSSSTEGSYNQRSRQPSSSSSNSSTYTDHTDWTVQGNIIPPNTSSREDSTQQRQPQKPVEDEFIESPVSSTNLQGKPDDRNVETSECVAQSVKPRTIGSPQWQREVGMPYSTEDHTPGGSASNNSIQPSRSTDIDPKKALQEFVARKQKERRMKAPPDQAVGNSVGLEIDESSLTRNRARPSPQGISSKNIAEYSSNTDNVRGAESVTLYTGDGALNMPDPVGQSESNLTDDHGCLSVEPRSQLFLSLQLNASSDEDPDIYV